MRVINKLLIVVMVLVPALAVAQRTTVTGTVLDSIGNAYANGSFSADYIAAAGCSSPPLLNGSTFQTSIPGSLSGTGALPSLSLADNNFVCSGSQWRFSVCNASKSICFQTLVTITGGSQNITSAIQSSAPPLSGPTSATNVTQIGGVTALVGPGTSSSPNQGVGQQGVLRVAVASDSFPQAPPQLPASITGNALLYRSAMAVYCQTNLVGCAPGSQLP